MVAYKVRKNWGRIPHFQLVLSLMYSDAFCLQLVEETGPTPRWADAPKSKDNAVDEDIKAFSREQR